MQDPHKRQISICAWVCLCVCYPVVTRCNIENGKKGQPNYTGGVHGESDELGLVEVLRALPGLEGIPKGRELYF